MKNSPSWLNKAEYPFTSKFMNLNGQNLHYIDEGQGSVLLFIHGTPSWSFEYRELIKTLSKNHRCIAYDHIGFGLSDKPEEYDYLLEKHASNLREFIDNLKLVDITLIVHDFGGPIALSYAVQKASNIVKIVAINTWAWSNVGEREFEKMKPLLKSPILPFLYKKLNFSPKVLLPKMFGKSYDLSSAIKKHYVLPFENSKMRNGALGFAKSLLNEQGFLSSLEEKLPNIQSIPTLLIWGEEDKMMTLEHMNKFQSKFDNIKTISLKHCGHFPQEEDPETVIKHIQEFVR
jgi:pimeloyl-ACP methyl ester carboxylesterase